METLDTYLSGLASSSATPGGGSAAMFVAAAGAALVAMVCRISQNNPKLAAHHQAAERIAAEADELRAAFIDVRKRDEDAFDRVVEAQRMPKSTDAQTRARADALEGALHHAAAVPLEAAGLVGRALLLAHATLAIESKNLISDVGCAAEFAHAALKACAYNVRINHKFMKNRAPVGAQSQELDGLEREGALLLGEIRAAVDGALK
ncbi:MAG: cyclodeaminase/cyclohydrolase family protein [Candidatus Eremiobacteraeota bacterium]|nr:cyclodeaminase/cyclohydrolase family protein [Candidatus Eremiobacteraeota bacterium]